VIKTKRKTKAKTRAKVISADWRFAEEPKRKPKPKAKIKPQRYSVKTFRAPFRKATEWGAEDELEGGVKITACSQDGVLAEFPLNPTGSHLDTDRLKSPFGEGEHCEQVPHLSDAIQTIGHVLAAGFYGKRYGKPVRIQDLTLKHLQPRSTEVGVDRDAWYRAIYQGIIALARTPQHHFLRADDPLDNPWRLPKSVAARIKPLEGEFPGGDLFFIDRAGYGNWRTPLSKRQMNRPLAHYRTWEEATTPRIGNAYPRPTKTQWKEELAFRKRIARWYWAEDQKYLLPCAWEVGRRLAAEDEKRRQEQVDRQRKQDLVDRKAPKKADRKTVPLKNKGI
jgi:hypothetical protein